MKTPAKNILFKIAEITGRYGPLLVLSVSAVLMLIAVFDTANTKGEAPNGSFAAHDFNEGWILRDKPEDTPVTLPLRVDREPGEEIVLINTLPDWVDNGSSLMLRSSMEDLYVYVDGELRAAYSSEGIRGMSFYIPSAHVVTELKAGDAGREVRLVLRVKTAGVVKGALIGYGNNVWFGVIRDGLALNSIAAAVLLLGVLLAIATLLTGHAFRLAPARQLSFLMIASSLWVFSESTLRQLIFVRPSMSQYFAYFLVEILAPLACLYFDEVQHRVYHVHYVTVSCLAVLQVVLNILLSVTGIAALYRTMPISHFWAAVCAVVSVICIAKDFVSGRVREYRITAFGMIFFVALALGELLAFYLSRIRVLGTFICVALLLLMTATVVQVIFDMTAEYKRREKEQTVTTINTIETIASAIDARDEYTGGHSERVGFYAASLAREMAALADRKGSASDAKDHAETAGCGDLSEEDILRIQYIGLVHDIGKIGVADNVLNKSGYLTSEEYSLMKKHTEIGYEIMRSLGEGITGLLEGIRSHHERYDGKGYPDGLKGTEIPLIARILAIADSYDAMTSNRVYRKRLTDEEVRNEIVRCSGTQFDPELAGIFLRLIDRGELSARTVEGIAAGESGKVLVSAVLENHLQRDLLNQHPIENPAHVRMLCYLLKLVEKRAIPFDVFFVRVGEKTDPASEDRESASWLQLTGFMEKNLKTHDVNIRYTASSNVVALFDRSIEETEVFIQGLLSACPSAQLTPLDRQESSQEDDEP